MRAFPLLAILLATPVAHAQLPSRLTLADAVQRAVATHPRAADAEAAVDEARARAAEARSALLPRIDFEESITRGNHPVYAFGTRLTQQRFSNEDLALDALNDPDALTDHQSRLSMEVPVVHVAGWLGSRAGRHQVRAARAGRRWVEANLVFETIRAYFGALLAKGAEGAAEQNLEAARADADRVRAMQRAGMATEVQALALEVGVAEAEERWVSARSQARLARASLHSLLDLPPSAEVPLSTPLDTQPLERPEGDLANHPALRVAASRSDAADAARRAASARWLPVLALYGDLQSHRPTFAGNGGESWTVGLVLRLNLFRGLGDWNNARASQAASRRAHAALEEAERSVRLEIEAARSALESAGARVALGERRTALAEEALRRERAQLAQGMSDTTSLMQRQNAHLGARLQHLSALHDRHVAAARLAMALGALDRHWEEAR